MPRSILAKPTPYKGINFRSRLEARWAAMFDILGWTWEYEPECEGAYIPDFLLHGFGRDARIVYVEVKPRSIYLANRKEIIAKARSAIGSSVDLLIAVDVPFEADSGSDEAGLGYMPPCGSEEEAIFRHNDRYRMIDLTEIDEQARLIRLPAFRGRPYDINHVWGFWKGRLSDHYDGNCGFETVTRREALLLWSQAGNAIQWKPANS